MKEFLKHPPKKNGALVRFFVKEMMRAGLPSDRFTVSRMLMRTLADGRRTWDVVPRRLQRSGPGGISGGVGGGS